MSYGSNKNLDGIKHTQQIDGKKPPLIPIIKIGLKDKKSEKMIFVQTILKC